MDYIFKLMRKLNFSFFPIKEVITDTRAHIQNHKINRDDLSLHVFDDLDYGSSKRIPPHRTPNNNDSILPIEFESCRKTYFKQCFGVIVQNAVWDTHNYALITPKGEFLADVSYQMARLPSNADAALRLKRLRPKNVGATALCLLLKQDKNYFHWLTEIIPQINLAQKQDIEYDYLLLRNSEPYQKEIIKHLSLPEEKIQCEFDEQDIRFDRIIKYSPPSRNGEIPKWVTDWLRNQILSKPEVKKSNANRKIVIMRDIPGRRAWANFSESEELLSSHGYEKVYMEKLSFIEQVEMIAQSKIIIGVHGAGLTNLIFANPSAKVIEFFHPGYINPCYYKLCSTLGLDYHYSLAERDVKGSRLIYADLSISKDKLVSMIEFIQSKE